MRNEAAFLSLFPGCRLVSSLLQLLSTVCLLIAALHYILVLINALADRINVSDASSACSFSFCLLLFHFIFHFSRLQGIQAARRALTQPGHGRQVGNAEALSNDNVVPVQFRSAHKVCDYPNLKVGSFCAAI